MRTDGRNNDQGRKVTITPEVLRYAEGSVQIDVGNTRLICTATIDEKVPRWLMGSGQGWVTAEYGMLPRSTHSRISRDKALNGGRTQEISRLIGRSLRAAVDLKKLGERQVQVDCDVIQADGGTRTAAITGGFVAMAMAMKFLKDQGKLSELPLQHFVAATSVGATGDDVLLDLNYDEDSTIETDMNIVMTDDSRFIEVQGTAEGAPFCQKTLDTMLQLAQKGCTDLFKLQREIIGN